jgi:hypothetical protein
VGSEVGRVPEQSHLEEMRAAIRADRERAAKKRGSSENAAPPRPSEPEPQPDPERRDLLRRLLRR